MVREQFKVRAGIDRRWWAESVNDAREGVDVLDEPHDPKTAEPSSAAPNSTTSAAVRGR